LAFLLLALPCCGSSAAPSDPVSKDAGSLPDATPADGTDGSTSDGSGCVPEPHGSLIADCTPEAQKACQDWAQSMAPEGYTVYAQCSPGVSTCILADKCVTGGGGPPACSCGFEGEVCCAFPDCLTPGHVCASQPGGDGIPSCVPATHCNK